MTPHELRQPWWDTPFRGVRAAAGTCTDTAARCRALLTALPDGAAFSHVTALRLLGIEVPWRLEPPILLDAAEQTEEPIHVVAPKRWLRPQRSDVVAHFCGQPALAVTRWQGMPVTTPPQTWLHLAHLLTADELVVLGDAMTRRKDPAATVDDLRRLLETTHKMRGLTACREAIELIRPGTDSGMESRARLVLVRAGLPCPDVNRPALDQQGRFLALPDMSYATLRIAIEYDGDIHRTDPATWRRDVDRRQRLEAAGWLIITATADDVLRHPDRFVSRVRDARRRRLADAR